jgi:hypothetical protein
MASEVQEVTPEVEVVSFLLPAYVPIVARKSGFSLTGRIWWQGDPIL